MSQEGITPASPLPWGVGSPAACVHDATGMPMLLPIRRAGAVDDQTQAFADARYAAHVANLYPELLAALKLLWCNEDIGVQLAGNPNVIERIASQVNAVIRKAEGR